MSVRHPLSWLERSDPQNRAVGDDHAMLGYGALCDRARRVAGSLAREHGSGRYLLLPAERSVDFVTALVAAWYSGNVPVPVDPEAPDELVRALGERCGPWARVAPVDVASLAAGEPVDQRDLNLPALVLFTSGTSGTPKGVPVSLTNLSHSAAAISKYLGYAAHPSAAVVLPLHYSYALLSQLLCMFYVGGYARIIAGFRNPLEFAKTVESEGLETFCGVPTTYQTLLTLRRLTPVTLPGVRVLCSAGAAFERDRLPAVKEIFPGARFFDNYGMTEATPRVTFIREDDPRFGEPTCGRAIEGASIRIFAESDLRELPDGDTGIIGVKGPNVFSGYLNDADATARAFTDGGYLLSGDVGYLDAGYLFVRGRRDEVFNVGGEKVSPVEIEQALLAHCAVESCAVAGFEDRRRGTVPVAYLVLRGPASKAELSEFLSRRLPAGKVPWRYFEASRLPMTANGKLQRRRLAPDDPDYVTREIG